MSNAYQPKRLAASINRSFATLPAPQLPRSTFNLSHDVVDTLNAGKLVPLLVDELLPSDTVRITPRLFLRQLTSISPVMDNLYVDWHAFFVPNRLLWDNWQKFMGERKNPNDSIDFTVPIVSDSVAWSFSEGGLGDHFGYPIQYGFTGGGDDPDAPIAFPHRAYRLIWNEWYRDQNLQDSVPVPTGDGPDIIFGGPLGNYDMLLPRGKRHGYLTSALPWPQKGDAAQVPLNGMAEVLPGNIEGNLVRPVFNTTQGTSQNITLTGLSMGDPTPIVASLNGYTSGVYEQLNWKQPNLHVDLSAGYLGSIETLRQAFAVQQMLEADARGGTRYIETLRRDFGAISPDFRLDRPEFIGGDSTMMDMTAVSNTADATGELTGIGTGFSSGKNITYSAVEHGILMILVSVRAPIKFQNRMDRRWNRRTRYDYYRHEMAHLGEQPILNKEVYFSDEDAETNNETWGYQERWAEYRYLESRVSGKMRSILNDSLDVWHYALDYDSVPPLNAAFIEDNPPIERTLEVKTQPQFKLQADITYHSTRVLPVYSVPGLLRL